MPGVLISIMKGEMHHTHRIELYTGSSELAPQLSITCDRPLTALTICSHNCGVVNDLQFARSRLLASPNILESNRHYFDPNLCSRSKCMCMQRSSVHIYPHFLEIHFHQHQETALYDIIVFKTGKVILLWT